MGPPSSAILSRAGSVDLARLASYRRCVRMRSVSLVTLGLLLVLAARVFPAQAPAAPIHRTPIPRSATPQRLSLSAENKARARKTLATAVEKREVSQGKPASVTSPGFQAHRCAVLYDPGISGKERAANGPFRTTCSDWVARLSRELAMKDAAQPCEVAQYGESFAGCTSWIDRWDAASGKWVNVWRQSSP
jgi:hypothetical protein